MSSPASAVTPATAYTPRERHLILTFAIVGALIESMELNLLSYPLRDLAGSFAVSTQSVVAVITWQSLASIAGGFLFGWVADRWGRRASYVVFTALYSFAAIVGGFVHDYTLFTLTRVVAGLAMGGAFGVVFAMFAESWRSPRRGFMGSVLQGMFLAGTLVTQLILFVTISTLGSDPGWRTGFVVIGGVCLAIAGAAAVWLPASTVVLTVGTLLGIVSYVVAGTTSDRIGRRRATLVASVVGVLAFAGFAFAGTGSTVVAVVALIGPAIGYAGFGVLGTWISEFYPTRYRAFGSNATYYVARGLGSGLFPLAAVSIAGGDLRIALALGGVGALVGLIGCLFVPDTAHRVITAAG
ncbi:MFS transporter [Pseudonocardia nematodicida]|uniref:MFS transporter n=1 Tax=Pseudonocardia nematodicida TaxID=1206997 RepID=A0ABV1K8V8_9PSEU